ncbi:MAG: helix-turn-helix transcriptional regulator [Hyphomicrobiales bacterium]|nr:helix-turn-helix transcriptional regulator [Hyphomicrobiales bacterium]MDE2017284.1 helix-turn-helix transcriptional regulator [Hyphomicrobiales bacterium]
MRRLMLRMTQGKLADAVGVTFQQVQKYEKGSNRIGASRLQQISETLGVPPSFFFQGAPGGTPLAGFAEDSAPYETEYLSTAEGLALNRAFARIRDPKVRRRVVSLVEAMADEDGDAGRGSQAKRAAG